jgi:hypothetical protein
MARLEVGSAGDIPLFNTTLGNVVGLPFSTEGKFFIVSAIVRSAVPQRTDIGSPADLIRDSAGQVIGAGSLDVNSH